MLTLSFQFIQRLGVWVIHCLPNWAVSVKKECACVLSYPSKQSGIHQVDSQKRLKREISFQKPFSNNGSWRRVRNGMEMRQEGTQRGGRQGLMSEWNIMDDRNRDTPDEKKVGMFMSEISKTCRGTGRTQAPLQAARHLAQFQLVVYTEEWLECVPVVLMILVRHKRLFSLIQSILYRGMVIQE